METVSGIDFDVIPTIKNLATYHLNDVPWDKALSMLLEDCGLKIDLAYNTVKIYQGQKYEVVFTEPDKAKIVIFLYRHFYKILLVIVFLAAGFLSWRFYRKFKRTQTSPLKNLLDPVRTDEIIQSELLPKN